MTFLVQFFVSCKYFHMKIEKLSQPKMPVSVSKAGAQLLQGASLFGTAEQKLDEGISNDIENCLRYTTKKKL